MDFAVAPGLVALVRDHDETEGLEIYGTNESIKTCVATYANALLLQRCRTRFPGSSPGRFHLYP